MNKKGFTLVEILAVVAILGVLAIITVPNIVKSVNKSKESNFLSEAQAVYKAAQNAYVLDKAKGYTGLVYTNDTNYSGKLLDVTNRDGFKYRVVFNADGEVVEFVVKDNDHEILIDEDLDVITLKDIKQVGKIGGGGGGSGSTTPTTPTEPDTPEPDDPGTTVTCGSNQFLLGGTCRNCPNRCTCDGVTATCSGGTVVPAEPGTGGTIKCAQRNYCYDSVVGACMPCASTDPVIPVTE